MKFEVRPGGDGTVRGRRLHPLQSLADRFERLRRVILGREESRLAFDASPEFEALPDCGQTVDRPEARRADRARTGCRRLPEVGSRTFARNDDPPGTQARQGFPDDRARDAEPIGEREFRGQPSLVAELALFDEIRNPAGEMISKRWRLQRRFPALAPDPHPENLSDRF